MAADPETAWRSTLVPEQATVREVIKNLERSGLQIALVASSDGVLIGTITDGDIRRGLLRGVDLESPIEGIIHRDALVAPPQMGKEAALHLMQANRLLQLPVVDAAHRVVGLHVWDALIGPAQRPNIMVIMAGGRGTRLLPHTETCPKPMLHVGGKPMLEHILARARGEGFDRFVLAVNYLAPVVEEYFGDGSRWQVRIDYVREQQPLGTAGALSLLDPRPEAPFVVANGDVLADIRYGELLDFHLAHRAAATMAVRLHEWQHPFGVVQTKGVDIVAFQEKPITRTHINAGIYALDPASLDVLAAEEPCDMPTLFERLQHAGRRTVVYPMHEPWRDVGQPRDLEQANADLGKGSGA